MVRLQNDNITCSEMFKLNTIQFSTIQCRAIQYNVIEILVMVRLQDDNISCSQTLHVKYNTVQYNTVQGNTIQYNTNFSYGQITK